MIPIKTDTPTRRNRWATATNALWRRPSGRFRTIEMTGLVGVMLILTFVLLAEGLRHGHFRGMSVEMAQIRHATEMPDDIEREDAMIVTIAREGHVYLGDWRIEVGDLLTILCDQLERRTGERKVYIKADANADYGTVARVVEIVRQAGVQNIGFLTEGQRRAGKH